MRTLTRFVARPVCSFVVCAVLAFGVERRLARAAEHAPTDGLPVLLANREIIVLRGPIAGYSAKERAPRATERIEQALARNPNAEVSTEQLADGTRVLLDGEPAFLVTRIDIDESIGETTSVVAREAARRLTGAVREWREQHTPRYLALATARALAATFVYAGLVWLLMRLRSRMARRISDAAEAQVQRLEGVSGVRLFDPQRLLGATRRIISGLCWLAIGTASVFWLAFVFEQFPYLRPWGESLLFNLLAIVKRVALGAAGAVPGLLLVAVMVIIARAVTQSAAVLFDRVKQGKVQLSWVDSETALPTRRLFNLVVWLFALAMAYPYLPGSDTDAFKGLSVLVGVMVSLGGSSLIGRAASGLTLMYSRPFRPGDYVQIGDAEGIVMDIGMFAIRLRTGIGEEVRLPSSLVMESSTKNYSRAPQGAGYIVDTTVTIGYATPWRQVQAMLHEAARRTSTLAAQAEPMVRQTALSDFYVEYRLVAQARADRPSRRIDVLGELHGHIQDVFNEYKVQIMSPHYEADPKQPQLVSKSDWYAEPAHAAMPSEPVATTAGTP